MRYLIWNVTYALNKFKDANKNKIKSLFIPYSQLNTHAGHRAWFACDGEKRRITTGFVDFSDDCYSIPEFVKNIFQIFAQKCPKGTFQIGIGNERGNKPASRCMRGGGNS